MTRQYDIVILGLSITSSWGNGHATTYRSLVRGLAARGHKVLFLERDMPWYAGNRDTPHPEGAVTELYESFDDLPARFEHAVADASLVIVGSFVPDGTRVGAWAQSVARGVTAFYDIDTPITLSKLASGDYEYITPELIPGYHMYLSFTGGPTLRYIESRYRAPMARALYCSVDPDLYRPQPAAERWDLGYLGTYSDDRQPALDTLLLEPARRWPRGKFAVFGPMYPEEIQWPANVDRDIHISPREHPGFYAAQRFTLNITRDAMKRAGHSPSVRLFEAGACGVPIISDWWHGLDELFEPGKEVLVCASADDTLDCILKMRDADRLAIGDAARGRILAEHTPERRARQLETYWKEANDNIPAHTPRRDRRRRQNDHGMETGLASERARQSAGAASGGEPGTDSDDGGVHKSAGARR